jgi:hypothetical protein
MRLACLLVLAIRLSLYHPPVADALLRSIRPLRDVTRVDSAGIPGHTSELDFRLIIDRGASSLIRLIVLELTCTSVQVGELGMHCVQLRFLEIVMWRRDVGHSAGACNIQCAGPTPQA